MSITVPIEAYRGSIRPVDLGGLIVGGGGAFPFHGFDRPLTNPPRVAFEVWDCPPDDWSSELASALGAVLADPVAWAAKVGQDPSAEAIYLRLKSADPHGLARRTEDVVAGAQKIIEAGGLPALVVGCGDPGTDAILMPALAEALGGWRVALGNAESDTYRAVGTAAKEHGHAVIAFTPMDVSLAKQLNTLLLQAGMDEKDIIMDPTCSALGYSFEYAFTVFERDRLAALAQNDGKMQVPLLATVGQETWHVKESRVPQEELPGQGSLHDRGVLWESITAVSLMLAGADMVVIRHPESGKLVHAVVGALTEEGPSWH